MSAERPPSLFAGVEPLEVFVELLAELDTDTSSTEFYDRICEAICRLTTMRRAAIFMADPGRRRVRPVGSYGTSFAQLARLQPTPALLSTPIAQRALLEDEVVVVSEGIEDAVPPEYAELFGITTLVCTPLSAAGRAYGVICADRGGGRFELTDGERHLLWTLGKTAALVATARNATRQQERNRRLGERLELAREIHERVMQRLFGVSLALSAEKPLDGEERERCLAEMKEALSDLRRALERPLAPVPHETGTTLAAELSRLAEAPGPRVEVGWEEGVAVPAERGAAGPVGARRGAAQHRQARPAPRRSTCGRRRRGHVHARGPQRRRRSRGAGRRDGAAAGRLRGAPARRRGRVRGAGGGALAGAAGGADGTRGAVSSPVGRPAARSGGCGCSWSTITTSCTGASGSCSASSRGWSAAWRRGPAPRRSSCCATFTPDVALVDLFLVGESGADVCDSIRKASPSTRVLLISGAGRMSPAAARAAGASGFVSKDWEAREVARAVRMVGLGMTVFAPTAEQPAPLLTEREREVLDLIAAGSTNREIAAAAVPVPAHRQGAHQRRVPQAAGAQPRRGGAAGPADRAARLTARGGRRSRSAAAHDPLDRRQLERVGQIARGEHGGADLRPGTTTRRPSARPLTPALAASSAVTQAGPRDGLLELLAAGLPAGHVPELGASPGRERAR